MKIMTASWPVLVLGLVSTFSLSACGTKGGLDCPPGSIEREDRTCLPMPKELTATRPAHHSAQSL